MGSQGFGGFLGGFRVLQGIIGFWVFRGFSGFFRVFQGLVAHTVWVHGFPSPTSPHICLN